MQPQAQTNFPPASNSKNWRVWWRLTRPHTLTAAFVPVLLGTALAMELTEINFGLFLLCWQQAC